MTFHEIAKFICDKEKISFGEINVPSQKREVVQVRHIIMYFCKHYTKMTHAAIGAEFGKDHSTISHGLKIISDLIDVDPQWRGKINYYHTHFQEIQKREYLYVPYLPDMVDLKKIRETLGISLRQAAAGAFIASKSNIREIENGTRGSQLPYNTVKRILDYYRSVAIEKGVAIITSV